MLRPSIHLAIILLLMIDSSTGL